MKTKVVEVHDLLLVLSLDEVESRIRDVSGVESVTVNFSAGTATLRYDDTQIQVDDTKACARWAVAKDQYNKNYARQCTDAEKIHINNRDSRTVALYSRQSLDYPWSPVMET